MSRQGRRFFFPFVSFFFFPPPSSSAAPSTVLILQKLNAETEKNQSRQFLQREFIRKHKKLSHGRRSRTRKKEEESLNHSLFLKTGTGCSRCRKGSSRPGSSPGSSPRGCSCLFFFFFLFSRKPFVEKKVEKSTGEPKTPSPLSLFSFLTPVEAPDVLVPDVEGPAVAVALVAVADVAVAVFFCLK